jgi:hypothetical protein
MSDFGPLASESDVEAGSTDLKSHQSPVSVVDDLLSEVPDIEGTESERPDKDAAQFDERAWSSLSLRQKSQRGLLSEVDERKLKVRQFVNSLPVQVFISTLIILDLILVFTKVVKNKRTEFFISFAFDLVYCVEVGTRIWATGYKVYFSRWLDVVDFLTVAASTFFTVLALILLVSSLHLVANIVIVLRVIRLLRLIRALTRVSVTRSQKIQAAVRDLNRSALMGFQDEKYNLNLSYITDNILVMAAPSASKSEQFKADPLLDVVAFLNDRHCDHYRVYELRELDAVDARRDSGDLQHLLYPRVTLNAIGSRSRYYPMNSLRDLRRR